MRRLPLLRVILLQTAASASGYAWGRALVARDTPAGLDRLDFGLVGIASAALLLVGLAIERRPVHRPRQMAWVCLATLGYAASLMTSEPFLDMHGDGAAACTGLLLLVPFLFAAGSLAREGAWAGALGAGLFFATGLAMIMRNGHSVWSGRGFFVAWVR